MRGLQLKIRSVVLSQRTNCTSQVHKLHLGERTACSRGWANQLLFSFSEEYKKCLY
jgi:hypothetical protein